MGTNYKVVISAADYDITGNDGAVSIRDVQKSDKKYGIVLENAVVSDIAKSSVRIPELAQITLRISDNFGNAVFETSGRNTGVFTWDLTNNAGRFVANSAYLVVVEASGVSGKVYRYSAKLGVRR